MVKAFKNFIPYTQNALFIAENASVFGNVELKFGASVWFNTVVRSENEKIVIGENSNVQDNCTVHASVGCPVTIGDNVTVGHNAVVHGCTVGDNCLIGMNSTILNGAKIGKNSIVGAGALVTQNKEFPDNSLIVGIPARVVKTLDDKATQAIIKNATHYAELAEEYSKIG